MQDHLLLGTPGGSVYGLLKDISMATKIAKAAKHCRLIVHNFDRSESLIKHLQERRPVVIILDWDSCESEAYKVLKEIAHNADFKSIMSIGFVSGTKPQVREEAQRAGCFRVYHKTEFLNELEGILARATP
jgi:DNA-binding NtrC family response regulator